MTLLFAAIAPALIVIIYIFIKDRYEKEPLKLLVYNFLLGAVVSVIITTLLYVIIDILFPLPNKESVFEQFFKAFFIVGLSEEFSKYIILRYYSQPHKEYNEPLDGIVYAVMVSMGFATTENLMYVLQGGMEVALIRAFTAIPAHATFAVLMGYFMGKAKFSNHRIVLNLSGLLLAMLFHGAYDFFLFIDFIPGIWIGASLSLAIAVFLSRIAIRRHQNISFFRPK